jgi:hypothetical protein
VVFLEKFPCISGHFIIDIDGDLHIVCVGDVAGIVEVHATSLFRSEVSSQ